MSGQRTSTDVQVGFTANQLIDELHTKYGALVSKLIQENSILQCTADNANAEIAELRAKVKALSE